MRNFVPHEIPRDFDARLVRILRDLNEHVGQTNAAIVRLGRGEAPSAGGGLGSVGITEHHNLKGLNSYDDHSRYLHLPGRVGGQTAYGAISALGTSSGTWAEAGNFVSAALKSSGTSWTGIAIDTNAAVGDVIVLFLSTEFTTYEATNTSASNNHSSISDTKGNTWTKLGEQQFSDGYGEGGAVSAWMCTVGTALVAATDTLSATYTGTMTAMAISSHRWNVVGGSPSLIGIDFLGEQLFTGSPPSSMTLSGLPVGTQCLFVRGSAMFNKSGAVPTYIADVANGYTACQYNGTAGGAANVSAFSEYLILAASGDSNNPSSEQGAWGSIYLALGVTPSVSGGLVLKADVLSDTSRIDLIGGPLVLCGTKIGFRGALDDSDLSYVRDGDGALIDKLVMASESTTDPGFHLMLRGFDNAPRAGTGGITSRSSQIEIDADIRMFAGSLLVAERSTDYTTTDGLYVATGLGFVNTDIKGTLDILGHASGGGTLLTIDHSNAGLTVVDFSIKKRASQTGDMLEFLSDTGSVMSYVRASDGAFVGPVVPSSGAVPTSRQINTTLPLTGGGALTADLTLDINNFDSTHDGAVPASGGGTSNFLRADGTWAAPAGGGGVTSIARTFALMGG